MAEMYTYAVARVRCREMALLTRADLSRLMQCQTEEECLRTLQDKGWGKDTATHLSAEEIGTGLFFEKPIPRKDKIFILVG